MTKRNTRRALLMSALSLVLCMSMLIGSTFAWFTDSVTSSGNKIQSGTLKLDLELLDKESGAWNSIKEEPNALFDNDKWEPGYTEVKVLKVANEGNLALKWYAKFVAEDGKEVSKLADAIDVYVLAYGVLDDDSSVAYPDRDLAGYTKVGTLADFIGSIETTTYGSLEASEKAYLGLALKMQEEAGNEYQGLDLAGAFDIQILATQLTSEKDSFDDQYDKLATGWNGVVDEMPEADVDNTITIMTAGELAAFANAVNGGNSYKGVTVKLGDDINLGNKDWTPIGTKSTPFQGTFDGQGYTIYNLYVNAIDDYYVGLFGYVNSNASITGVNVRNVDLTGYAYTGAIAGQVYTGSVKDCHVTGTIKIISDYAYAGGIVGGDYVNLADCSVVANGVGEITVNQKTGAGGICGWHYEGNYQLINCQVKNLKITSWANVGGITGFVHYGNIIDNCVVENVTLTKTREGGNGTVGLAAGGFSYDASNAITITNNTFKDVVLNGNYIYYESTNILHGGEYGGAASTNFVIANNTQENITNNLVEVEK